MKKATVIVQAKNAEATVKNLRHLGILHIEHQNAPQGKDLNLLQEDAALLNGSLDVFNAVKSGGVSINNSICPDWKATARHVIGLWKRYDQLEAYSQVLKRSISEWERWGDFEPEKIEELRKQNIFVKFYAIPLKQKGGFPASVVVEEIFTAAGFVYCLAIAKGTFGCPYKEIPLPKQSLSQMHNRLRQDKKAMDSILNEIRKAAVFSAEFMVIRKRVEKEIELQQAINGMGQESGLSFISGYIPFDKTETLLKEAAVKHWGVVINDPGEEDNIPTLIRNPAWVSLISPVFKLLEIVPGYRELDISLLFLIFFSLFFGILIGDAGYGGIYLILTFWVQRKMGKKITDKNCFSLFYILSFCAIVWGLLTGSIFGQQWLIRTGFKPLLPALNNTKNIQAFCFFIGALHLTFAHSWRALLKFPSLTALADIGWVLVLWAAFFFAKLLILGELLPAYTKWLLIAGVSLATFFTNPQRNILKTIGKGLAAVALSLMNNFTDVVSYVRLFAVGLAGVAIADTFNNMAASVGSGSIIALVASGFIILTGHGLNLILGPMSVLVHGVRLNVLEFSGHANVSWSGFVYKPLKE